MSAALVAEIRKLLTTRAWWVVLVVMIAYLGFMGAIMGLAFGAASSDLETSGAVPTGIDAATSAYSLANPIGYVFPLLIGSLVFTSEFRHKTVTGALLVDARRGTLLAAKLGVGALLGLVYGLVAVLAVVVSAGSMLALFGDGAFLGSADVWSVIGWTVVVFCLWSTLGVAFGGLLTNQVAAIVVILAFTQFVEPVARFIGSVVDVLSPVAQFLPGAAADSVIGASFFTAMAPAGEGPESLSRWAGLLVLLAYAAVFAAGARLLTLRRDIA